MEQLHEGRLMSLVVGHLAGTGYQWEPTRGVLVTAFLLSTDLSEDQILAPAGLERHLTTKERTILKTDLPMWRKTQWVVGRLVGKYVTREWARQHRSKEVSWQELQISPTDGQRKPQLDLLGPNWSDQPDLSLAHKGRWYLAGVRAGSVGVDVEEVREFGDSLRAKVLGEKELEEDTSLSPDEQAVRDTTRWVCKESAAKLWGKGLVELGFRNIWTEELGRGRWRVESPNNEAVEVHTRRFEKYVFGAASTSVDSAGQL